MNVKIIHSIFILEEIFMFGEESKSLQTERKFFEISIVLNAVH